jgi:hypothetical protein
MQEDQDTKGSNRRRAGLVAVIVAGVLVATGLAGFAVFSNAHGAGASQLAKPQDQGPGSTDSPSTENGGTDPASSGLGGDPSSYLTGQGNAPSNPAGPNKPADPQKPADPNKPGNPNKPCDPSKPGNPQYPSCPKPLPPWVKDPVPPVQIPTGPSQVTPKF